VKEAERAIPVLSVRKHQITRALRAKTVDGKELLTYLKLMKNDLVQKRSVAEPTDVQRNTELHGQVRMLEDIIQDWSEPEQQLDEINRAIKEYQEVLDNSRKV
jgi:hypothetical protein